jgi:hypothetical protein
MASIFVWASKFKKFKAITGLIPLESGLFYRRRPARSLTEALCLL